ncbi:MAG: nuclear transport factor 2 family protein [Acidimicrobiia bacterium]
MESVRHYFAAWNETDPAARLALVREAFGEGSSYVDPQADVRGHQEIADMMGIVQATFPGHTLALVSAVERHHDRGRFEWEIRTPTGELMILGVDVVTFDGQDRLVSVVGFFGRVVESVAA